MKVVTAMKFFSVLFFLVVFLNGCGNTRFNRLQKRVDGIEERLDVVEKSQTETAAIQEDRSYPPEVIIAEAPPQSRRCPDSLTKKDIQRALRQAGYYSGAIDGVFGPLTEKAVKNFQRDHGLKVDGITGPVTRRALVDNIRW